MTNTKEKELTQTKAERVSRIVQRRFGTNQPCLIIIMVHTKFESEGVPSFPELVKVMYVAECNTYENSSVFE